MKTQILRLEPHDDLVSVRDKMNWGQTGRILLVWPGRGRILTRRLDLVLVQRQAAAQGAQLALVTTDAQVREYARDLGIPVYSRLKQAQNDHWRAPRRVRRALQEQSLENLRAEGPRSGGPPEPPPRSKPGLFDKPALRLVLFSLGVFALLALGAALLPGGSIDLHMERREQAITLEVSADPRAGAINFSGIVPARPVEVVVEGRAGLPAEGEITVPDSPATGRVRFTNLTDQSLEIPAGSVARTPGEPAVRFATLSGVTIPPGPGTSQLVEVQALEAGSQGNLEPDSLTAVEGELGTRVAATNPQQTRNGSDRTLPAPTAAQRDRLSEELLASLRRTARSELEGVLNPGDVLLPGSLSLAGSPESSFDPPRPGDPADELSLNLQATFTALAVSSADLEALAAGVLDANLPAGFQAVPASLAYQVTGEPVEEAGGRYRLSLQLSRQVQAQVSTQSVVRLVMGLEPEQARQRLIDNLPLESAPRVLVEPDWWPRLPLAPFRIQVLGMEQ